MSYNVSCMHLLVHDGVFEFVRDRMHVWVSVKRRERERAVESFCSTYLRSACLRSTFVGSVEKLKITKNELQT